MKFKKFLIILFILIFTLPNCIIYAENNQSSTVSEPALNSEAAILIDANTGMILYSKNADKKMYPASTTKILTSIIAIENCNLTDKVTVNNSAISTIPSGYSSAGLVSGEVLTVEELLTVFLVHSANEAGNVLAEYISGSINEFSNLMNEKAQEIGCTNSNFLNPSGIHNDNHYSTAYDLSLIARYCMKNSTFRNIVSMPKCIIGATNKSEKRTYSNTNDLINPSSKYYLEDCIGIKTGYTSEAKNCLISACSKNGIGLICVVLGAGTLDTGESGRYVDSKALFNYGYSNYSLKTIFKKDAVFKTIEIDNGTKETRSLDLILEDDLTLFVKNDEEITEPTICLKDNLSAPIAQNSSIGTLTYNINGVEYTQNLLASHNVEEDSFLLFVFEIALAVIIIFIILTMVFSRMKKRNNI